jgi:hypothetical protein
MNLYGYAGADPINRSDPFGLCSQAADSVQVTVTVDCPGSAPNEKATIWVHRVSETEEQAILTAAGSLSGGSRLYPPARVAEAYQAQARTGGIYSFPISVNGGTVIEGGVTQHVGGVTVVGFRADVVSAAARGDLGLRMGSGTRAQNVANIIGHEGIHLLGETGEMIPDRVRWGIKP